MAEFVPDYYKDFKCIAGKCRHSCCIGWEIDIDKDTFNYYKTVSGEFGKKLKKNIKSENGEAHFGLDENERCPFLNNDNLCDIIINLGEDKLSNICAEHPRFVNFYDTVKEKGLGMCCEAVCRLVLTREEKMQLICTKDDGELMEDEKAFFDYRKKLFDILQDRTKRIDERVLSLLKFSKAEFPQKTYAEWKKIYLELENLDALWKEEIKELDSAENSTALDSQWDTAFEQLLVYFIYRHLADSLYFGDFKARICFAVLGYKIIKKLFINKAVLKGEEVLSDLLEISRMYSSEIEYSVENTEKLLEILENAQNIKTR